MGGLVDVVVAKLESIGGLGVGVPIEVVVPVVVSLPFVVVVDPTDALPDSTNPEEVVVIAVGVLDVKVAKLEFDCVCDCGVVVIVDPVVTIPGVLF